MSMPKIPPERGNIGIQLDTELSLMMNSMVRSQKYSLVNLGQSCDGIGQINESYFNHDFCPNRRTSVIVGRID